MEIKTLLLLTFSVRIEEGTLTEKVINALSECMSYVQDYSKVKSYIAGYNEKGASAMYSWAIAHSSIAFPYLTLNEASEKVSSSLEAAPTWGLLSENNILLPDPSSHDDSAMWHLINNLAIVLFGQDSVNYFNEGYQSVPSLDNDTLTKDRTIYTILHRIVELKINPLSATIRGSSEDNFNSIKNAVDFIILEGIKNKFSIWDNLLISDLAVRDGRRIVSTATRKGKQEIVTKNFIGFRLASLLKPYLPKEVAKSPESEPFIALLLGLLRKMIPESLPDGYEIPKSFLMTPSHQLRKSLRKGPLIRTKKGEKSNLYIPFSFYKSAECELVPLTIRRESTNLGNEVVKTLDKINTLSASSASSELPNFAKWLEYAYTVSDMCRVRWRRNQEVPDIENEVRPSLFNPIVDTDEEMSVDTDKLQLEIDRAVDFSWACPISPADRLIVEETINKSQDKRRRAGANRSSV
jgi:hypothetical protein